MQTIGITKTYHCQFILSTIQVRILTSCCWFTNSSLARSNCNHMLHSINWFSFRKSSGHSLPSHFLKFFCCSIFGILKRKRKTLENIHIIPDIRCSEKILRKISKTQTILHFITSIITKMRTIFWIKAFLILKMMKISMMNLLW